MNEYTRSPAEENDAYLYSPRNVRQLEACPMRINGHSNESSQNDVTACDLQRSHKSWPTIPAIRKMSLGLEADCPNKRTRGRIYVTRACGTLFLLTCVLLTLCLAAQTCFLIQHVRTPVVVLSAATESVKPTAAATDALPLASVNGTGFPLVASLLAVPENLTAETNQALPGRLTSTSDTEVRLQLSELLQNKSAEYAELKDGFQKLSDEMVGLQSSQRDWQTDTQRSLARVLSRLDALQKQLSQVTCSGTHTVRSGSSCFHFSGTLRRTWPAARLYCQQLGGDLASMETSDSNRMLQERAGEFGMSRFWVGLHASNASVATASCATRRWTWVSSGLPPSFVRWAPGEPNGCASDEQSTTAENCAEVWVAKPNESPAGWNDRACLTVNSFVCQVSPSPASDDLS